MPTQNPTRQAELRALVATFLTECRDSKAEKLAPDDPKRIELQAQFTPAIWIDNAAKQFEGLQAVTHPLKATHPTLKIKEATNILVDPSAMPPLDVVGTHALGDKFAIDVTGNGALLGYYKLLKLEHDGRSLLDLAIANDDDLAAALSDNDAQARGWMAAFAGLAGSRSPVASHTLAKQLYWPTGGDPRDDASFHLLAPLYASSLAHRVHALINDDRFSEPAKAARLARREQQPAVRDVHEYPDLAVQNLGGTKPHNVSQLNSERYGNNYLLASLPPIWRVTENAPLFGVESMFERNGRFSRRAVVRAAARSLRAFLQTNPTRNVDTREHRDAHVEMLIDELLQFTAELHSLPPGWSRDARCRLGRIERRWLDPEGQAASDAAAANADAPPLDADVPEPDADTADEIAHRFANWLNRQLRDPLPMNDETYRHWLKLARDQFAAEAREAADVV